MLFISFEQNKGQGGWNYLHARWCHMQSMTDSESNLTKPPVQRSQPCKLASRVLGSSLSQLKLKWPWPLSQCVWHLASMDEAEPPNQLAEANAGQACLERLLNYWIWFGFCVVAKKYEKHLHVQAAALQDLMKYRYRHHQQWHQGVLG